jgi:tetratricopeptide (TPR) repeat protein
MHGLTEGDFDSLGRYEGAIECYDKALGIDPRMALAQKNKKIALRKDARSKHGEQQN